MSLSPMWHNSAIEQWVEHTRLSEQESDVTMQDPSGQEYSFSTASRIVSWCFKTCHRSFKSQLYKGVQKRPSVRGRSRTIYIQLVDAFEVPSPDQASVDTGVFLMDEDLGIF